MGDDDAELVRGWQGGDAAAFETLVRRWQEPVARLLFRLVGNAGSVPDLCQDVFLRVHRGRDRFRGDSAFSTWLYRIALNVARDQQRRRTLNYVSLNGKEPHGPSKAPDQAEVAALVARALAELPAPLREVVVLRHYEQMKFEEIARLTGTAASTLKSRFAVALRQLKVRLEQLGLGPEEWS